MKNLLFFKVILLVGYAIGHSQNLVVNYSFEEYNQCPYDYNQADFASDWYESTASNNPQYHTEYLNACGTSQFSAPSNTWGYQAPSDGNGYQALSAYAPTAPGHRENIYSELIAPLIPGNYYHVSFKVSKVDNVKRAADKLGVKFSTNTSFPINNIAHVYSTSLITDQAGWVEISGNFLADSAYQYIAVGNFFDDLNVTIVEVCSSCPFTQATYYIDEVCVVRGESGDCNQPLSPSEILNSDFLLSLSPNPAAEVSQLNLFLPHSGWVSIQGVDAQGKDVFEKSVFAGQGKQSIDLNLENISPGIYLLQVSFSGHVQTRRLAVQ